MLYEVITPGGGLPLSYDGATTKGAVAPFVVCVLSRRLFLRQYQLRLLSRAVQGQDIPHGLHLAGAGFPDDGRVDQLLGFAVRCTDPYLDQLMT